MSRAGELMQAARSATGLADFGSDGFREGLERLVASVDGEARLTPAGRMGFDFQVTDLLTKRLQVEHWYHLHPEIEDQRIVAPLIGLGLPRTGSTALSCLLAEDPAVRFIRNWEAHAPCPPPESTTEHSDPRIEIAHRMVLKRHEMFPRKKAMLPSSATMPTECQTYMGYDFKSHLFQALWQVPSYSEWLNREADLVQTYHYVKRVLKLLQWRCPPRRWRLKNPSHIVFIGALHEVFTDARYWMTHRDIGKVLPSVADLYFELMQASSDQVDKHYLGALNSDWCELGMRRLIAFREAGNEHRFFDIHFEPFQQDPFPIIAGLYDFLGETLTDQARARMEAWRRATPRDQHGEHHYEAGDFGLDIVRLRERFGFYHQRFGLPTHRSSSLEPA